MFTRMSNARDTKQPHDAVIGVPLVDPLALDPYSPTFFTRDPERTDSDPLALYPYSPTFPARAA